MGRGRRSKGRNITGILLLDKPIGRSSNAALQSVKRLYDARKAGHTGSLDPLATGLLPICFGHATKLSGYLLDADKTYWVRAKLGERTETGDAEGEVSETAPVPALDEAIIQKVIDDFIGEQDQLPPMYSALKHKGKRLYELARAGEVVERPTRRITVFEMRFCGLNGDTVAHVIALRRTAVGPFKADGMVDMGRLEELAAEAPLDMDELLLPMSSALGHWPEVELDADSSYYLQRGQAVQVSGAPTEGMVCIYDHKRQFVGVGEIQDDGLVAPRRLMKD